MILRLKNKDFLRLLSARGVAIEVLKGRVWITEDGHAGDAFIGAGRRYQVSGDGLVLIDSGFSPTNDVLREVQASLATLQDPVSLEFARQFQASTVYAPVPPEFFEGILAESVKLPAPLWRAALSGLLAFDDLGDLRRIVAPTLILWGDRDALFPRDDQDSLAAAIPGARLRVYPETGHCPNWEVPAQVAADLDAFIRET